MLSVVCFILFVPFWVNSFLLETTGKQFSGISDQFVSLTEFQSTKETLQRENDELRHRMQQMQIESKNTIAVLTSQLQAKFQELEQNLNASKYIEFKCDCGDLEKTVSHLLTGFDNLKKTTKHSEAELAIVKQTVEEHDVELKSLRQLEAVKQLEALGSIEQRVQNIETETHTLSVNEQARRNDFLAFRNEFLNLKNESMENGKNISALQSSTLAISKTIAAINSTEENRCAFLAGVSGTKSNLPDGTSDIFDKVKFNKGACYDRSTGKFTANENGLYMFSWTTVSDPGKDFTSKIVKNSNYIAVNAVDSDSVSDYMTGSQTVVIEMNRLDKVWVEVDGNEGKSIDGGWNGKDTSVFCGFKI